MRDTALFLSGINLGGRRLRMDDLRGVLEDAGLQEVRTFIASGNVVVDGGTRAPQDLESSVAEAIQASFGFDTQVFTRTLPELTALTERAEGLAAPMTGFTAHVLFLRAPPDQEARRGLGSLTTPDDLFEVLAREVVWLRRGGLADSTVKTRDLQRALNGAAHTMRKVTMLRRMVDRFGS
jgi:uncharacterized protein (DUF1697 family)